MMSGQDQTTANKPSEPILCKMGCGFFGSGATGDCCSKCWRDLQKKQGRVDSPKSKSSSSSAGSSSTPQEPQPMEVEPIVCSEVGLPTAADSAGAEPKKVEVNASTGLLKKKKTSYKNMMASMMKNTPERDLEKEKEALRKVTGGGAFSKIDKI